jgi:hypothetical protein
LDHKGANVSSPITVLVIKVPPGRFKAIVGDQVEYGDYATTAARAAAAKHFGVPEDKIEVDPINATLSASVKGSA